MSNQPPSAPPPYDDAQKYPTMYPDPNTPQQGANYQPNMTNPYPQPGLQQQPHQHQQPASTTTYVYVSEEQPQFGPRPQNVFCQNCRQQTLTKIKYNAGLLTWLLFGGCLLFGCWMGCCLIPFCIDDCQDCEHYCSNCKAFVGQYKRL